MEITYSRADLIGSSGRRLPESGSGQRRIAGPTEVYILRYCINYGQLFTVVKFDFCTQLTWWYHQYLLDYSSRMSSEIFFINSLTSPGPRTYQRSSPDLARSKYQRLIRACLAFPIAKKTAKRWATFSGPIHHTNQGKEVGERGMECFAALHTLGQVPAGGCTHPRCEAEEYAPRGTGVVGIGMGWEQTSFGFVIGRLLA